MNKPNQSPWAARIAASSIALALAACGAEAPPPAAPAEADAPVSEELPIMGPERVILGFGDSLMAGYQLGEDEGYPEVLEDVLRARGVNARVVDAGVSGDTTAAGLQRIEYVLDNLEETPDLAIVELGGNDLLRGLSPDETRSNLGKIIAALKSRDIPVLLMGMRAPPNYGPEFQSGFDGLYRDLAKEYDTALVPFFMAPLVTDPSLLMDDRVHPTAEGVREMVAATVDQVAEALPEEE
ncbi:arylesterase [Aurantiacibacter aquimixticola]|uniref:Arylesterase n=1 Tax=Aurantiacibacter aquimixticola TaxID=1958945 RepID=A0A419RT37_9SPHN|nr:arylesterase [Aurantiacibacter aquimixticola]RJY08963.1 arylesterase [Aurantiacibacter aquimixticola]